ncbi:MAG: hypothetical protein II703_04985, partial [Ruminococcus sp.]|nr:hypothetical protein [Ruminococcus sp.]
QCYAYAHGKCGVSHSISISKLNDILLALLDNASVTGDFKLETRPREAQGETEDIAAMISREERKLDRIREAFENEVYTIQEYKESRARITERIESLRQRQHAKAPDEQQARRQVQSRILSLLPALRSPALNESDKSTMLRSIIERVVFYRSTGGIDVFFYA